MAQKINPNSLRLGLTIPWSNRWFFKRNLRFFLEEDCLIRKIIKEKILAAGIASVDIERTSEVIRISIRAGRPGLIIGRGGKGIEDLKNNLIKAIKKLRSKKGLNKEMMLSLNVEELRRSEASSADIAQQIAFDMEKRLPYRILLKRNLDALKQNRSVLGAKIKVSGR